MTELPNGISVEEQASAAGRRRTDISQGIDDIDKLKVLVRDFCNEQGAPTSALSAARTNFEQAFFWLRSHRNLREE